MDGKIDVPVDLETQIVSERLAETRQHIGDTVEALAYKANVPARASDAVADGIAVAKENLAAASDVVTDQAVGAAATVFETVESAKVAAADVAAVAKSNVPEAVRSNARSILIGIAIFAAIAFFVGRRRGSKTVIDGTPEVEAARQRLD